MRRVLMVVCASLMLAPTVHAVSVALPDLGDASATVLSRQAELELGQESMRQLRTLGGYLNDPEVNAYLNRLGHRLLAAAPGIEQSFEFFAVPASDINAFALPGGFIGVHIGLIQATESESELAAVLAHEISHVTQHHIARQIAGQSGSRMTTLAATVAAIVAAAAGNGQVASAAMSSATALHAQNQLNYTRDHEHEADRIGFEILDAAGFDPHAMAAFFQRMQRANRLLDSNAPGYLRTHPLTHERIAEAQDRARSKPYRQVPDSLDFHLVRALLRSYEDPPESTIERLSAELAEGRYRDRTAARYGLAAALLRGKAFKRAQAQIDALEREGRHHPMIEALAGQILVQSGQLKAARSRYEAALALYPSHLQLVYDYPRLLIMDNQPAAAAEFAKAQLVHRRHDATLHRVAAEAYAALDRKTLSHHHQGEYLAALGDTAGAAEQFELAVRADDGSFRDLLAAEARLGEMRERLDTEKPSG